MQNYDLKIHEESHTGYTIFPATYIYSHVPNIA